MKRKINNISNTTVIVLLVILVFTLYILAIIAIGELADKLLLKYTGSALLIGETNASIVIFASIVSISLAAAIGIAITRGKMTEKKDTPTKFNIEDTLMFLVILGIIAISVGLVMIAIAKIIEAASTCLNGNTPIIIYDINVFELTIAVMLIIIASSAKIKIKFKVDNEENTDNVIKRGKND